MADCSGVPKRSAGLSKTAADIVDTLSSEFLKIDAPNFDIAGKIRADISEKKEFNREDYRTDYLGVADKYRNFISKYPGSDYSKTALISVVHIYKLLGDYDGMKTFLESVMTDRNLAGQNSLAKRFMIEYYSSQNDFSSAIRTADEILSPPKGQTADTSLICDALYAKGYIYAHNLDNKDEAVKCFSEIIDNHSDNSLVTLANNEMRLLGAEAEKPAKEKVAIDENAGIIANCYPNPFNPATVIEYTLHQDERVVIKVYDILGREVEELVNEYKSAGKYSARFDESKLSSGVYFYKIRAGKLSSTGKMLLTK